MLFFSSMFFFIILFILCLKKVNFFLKLESNLFVVYNIFELEVNKMRDIFVGI